MILIFLGVIGASFGSFAGALVWRLHTKRNFVSDRSICENCHHQLGALDLVPIFSWLFLKGKCRYCHKSISPKSLILEILTAGLFMVSYIFWPQPLADFTSVLPFVFWLAYVVGCVALAAYDLRWKLLPDKIVMPLIGLAAVDLLINRMLMQSQGLSAVTDVALGVVTISGFFALLFVVSKGRWIGFGDVKLGIFMGLVLGGAKSFIALLGSYYIAMAVILPLLLLRKVGRSSHIPFGPFLLAAFFVSFLFGGGIIDWWHRLFLGA